MELAAILARVVDAKQPWLEFEAEIVELLEHLDPGATLVSDARVTGSLSGTPRQLDALVTGSIVGERIQLAIECKAHQRRVDLPVVEAFWAKLHDVRADRGVMFSTSGFTASAVAYATNLLVPKVTLQAITSSEGAVGIDWSRVAFGLQEHDVAAMLELLGTHQVLLLNSGPGTGRSTLAPFALAVGQQRWLDQRGGPGQLVVVKQTIRATRELATYVGEKLARTGVGPGRYVGYEVGGDRQFDAESRLVYATDGAVVARLLTGGLDGIATVYVDDTDLRSQNLELILGVLRERVASLPHLRVVLASADSATEQLMRYFRDRVPVAHYEVSDSGGWGYGEPLWPGSKIALEQWDELGPPEADGHRPRLREHSAALLSLRSDAPADIATLRRDAPELVAAQLDRLLGATQSGDIVAFLPTGRMVAEAANAVRERNPEVTVHELTSIMPEAELFAALRPGRKRRVIITTAFGEISIALSGLTYVVDSGLDVQAEWDPELGSFVLPVVAHCKRGAQRRWSKVGRSEPGWVFPLYSPETYDEFSESRVPGILSSSLDRFVLTATALGVEQPELHPWLSVSHSFGSEAGTATAAGIRAELARARGLLERLGAVTRTGEISSYGAELLRARTQHSISGAHALLAASRIDCLPEMALALAVFENGRIAGPRGIFGRAIPGGWRPEGALDDLDVLLATADAWMREPEPEVWSARNGISHEALATHMASAGASAHEMSGGSVTGRPSGDPIKIGAVRAILVHSFAEWRYSKVGSRQYVRQSAGGPTASLAPRQLTNPGPEVIAFQRARDNRGNVVIRHLVAATRAGRASSDDV